MAWAGLHSLQGRMTSCRQYGAGFDPVEGDAQAGTAGLAATIAGRHEINAGVVLLGNLFDDGQAQPTAVGTAAKYPIKAIEHALAVFGRDARTRILYFDIGR